MRLLFVAGLLPLLSSSVPAQLLGGVWEDAGLQEGLAIGDHLGRSVAGGGDYDGDGVPDWLVGSPRSARAGSMENGRVDVVSGFDGSILGTIHGYRWDRLGISVAWLGDIDGDGRSDILAGGWYGSNPNSGAILVGRVYVWSSAAGGILRTHYGNSPAERFGGSIAGGHDLDLDGVNDYLVGARNAVVAGQAVGSVFAYSGATGAQLFRLNGTGAGEYFGAAVDFAGDVDGDGTVDLLIGAAEALGSAGFARVYSGATGAQILQIAGLAGDRLGADVAGLGDVDGDGFADFAAGAPTASGIGAALVFSGFSGNVLHQFDGVAGSHFGFGLAAAGDVDGDGETDLLVGAPPVTPADLGFARLYTASSGDLMREFASGNPGDGFGFATAGVGDQDGNGCDEIVIGVPHAANSLGQAEAGQALLYSFNPILFTDVVEMGAVAGGQVQCSFDFPASEAGMRYAMVVSYSGFGPTNYAGIDIPLTRDSMFDRLVVGNPPPIFTAPYGVLDANGDGSTIYIGDALWLTPRIGETFRGCAVSYDAVGGRIVSRPRQLTILP